MNIIEDKDVAKTSKPHRCFGCLQIIPAGSPAHVQANNDGGTIGRVYMHLACEKIMREMANEDMYYDDDYIEGCVTEELRDRGFKGSPEEYVEQLRRKDA